MDSNAAEHLSECKPRATASNAIWFLFHSLNRNSNNFFLLKNIKSKLDFVVFLDLKAFDTVNYNILLQMYAYDTVIYVHAENKQQTANKLSLSMYLTG